MKAATIHDLKQELLTLPQKELIDLCLRLARFKKENKELLTYLLFEAGNEEEYIENVKKEIDHQFEELNLSTLYFTKKGLRKILRTTTKFIRYTGSSQAETALLMYFCTKIKAAAIPVHKSAALINLYQQQVKKIKAAISELHEDLQYDYLKELEQLK